MLGAQDFQSLSPGSKRKSLEVESPIHERLGNCVSQFVSLHGQCHFMATYVLSTLNIIHVTLRTRPSLTLELPKVSVVHSLGREPGSEARSDRSGI